MKKNIAVVILAAGKGTRMKSGLPKILHTLCARPILGYVLDLVKGLKISKTAAVLGYKFTQVKPLLPKETKVVIQKQLKGTADAVKLALSALKGFKGTVLVLYGDVPLLKKETLEKLIKFHQENNPAATLLTSTVIKPAGYGRILRDEYSSICAIVEEKDADEFQKDIKEINTGIVCFDKEKLESALRQVRANNSKKEYYLTDVIGILYKDNQLIEGLNLEDIDEAMGINSRVDLAKANSVMQRRINEKLMLEGVTIVDPATSLISHGTKIGQESVIYPFTVIERDVKIGKRCVIGPFVHLREGTRLEDDVSVGNFLEVVRSKIGSNTLIKHFSYLGDVNIGRGVNIGAGTVTANFDGHKKQLSVIKDGAFIGSDTILVAPVKIGRNAITGAGSVVVKNTNVPDKGVVVGVPAKPLSKKR